MLSLDTSRICVTGGAGFLGRQVVERLIARGVSPEHIHIPRRSEYDLTRESNVVRMYQTFRPDVVIHMAAEIGGIGANQAAPGRFLYANLAMGLHLIEHARRAGLRKFVQVGTVCSYPKHCSVPFFEENLWSGYPEETNAPYGVAKKTLHVMLDAYCRQYALPSVVVIPANLYGPHDHFDLNNSHVIPAIIRKIETARIRDDRKVRCWGTGRATRDFLYVQDAAEAIVRATESIEQPDPINLGTGVETSMLELTERLARIMDYHGSFVWDATKPDGQPRRCVSAGKAMRLLDWTSRTPLGEGLRKTVEWFRSDSATRSM